jgi:hypothetical protein
LIVCHWAWAGVTTRRKRQAKARRPLTAVERVDPHALAGTAAAALS